MRKKEAQAIILELEGFINLIKGRKLYSDIGRMMWEKHIERCAGNLAYVERELEEVDIVSQEMVQKLARVRSAIFDRISNIKSPMNQVIERAELKLIAEIEARKGAN
jgi:hypothetical protein